MRFALINRIMLAPCILERGGLNLGLMIFLLTLILYSPLSAQAHELRPTIAEISASSETVEINLRTNLEALISEIGSEHENSDDSPQSSRYDMLRSLSKKELEREFRVYLPTLLDKIVVNDASVANRATRLPVSFVGMRIPAVGDTRLPRDSTLTLAVTPHDQTTAITWLWHEQFGAIILRKDTVKLDDGKMIDAFSQYVQSGQTSEPIALSPYVIQNAGSTMIDYIAIGFEHIIPKGLDHILFVVGLFLLAPRVRPIVWQVSMFTIAHTVTLALGITGMISLPGYIIEPLIALSITIICVENLTKKQIGPSRLLAVFAFGLLHGLGFAGVLSDIGLQSDRFFSSLLAFNVGVELGQLTVVFACFVTVGWWFGSKPWYRKIITIPASLATGAIGLLWFVQRVA